MYSGQSRRGLKRNPTTPTDHDRRRVADAAELPASTIDQENDDFNCRYFSTSIAINAVHTWVRTALALVPTKVLIFNVCFSALKNNSICQRSLYMAAMVVAPKANRFERNTMVSSSPCPKSPPAE